MNVSVNNIDTNQVEILINTLDEFKNLDRVLLPIASVAIQDALVNIQQRVVGEKETAYGGLFHYHGNKAYSDSHEVAREQLKRQTSKRDFYYTGDMWKSKRIKERKRSPFVRVVGGVYGNDSDNKSNVDKLIWNTELELEKNSPIRIMEMSEREQKELINYIVSKLDEAITRRIKRNAK